MKLLKIGFLCGLAALSVVTPAQRTKWLLGRPALHIVMPGDAKGGGVSWSRGLGLGTSWSSEADGVRVEVAMQPMAADEAAVQAELKRVLPEATVSPSGTISNFPAWIGTASGAKILGIKASQRLWVVLVKGPDQAANAVLSTVTVERDDAPRWQRRSWGGTGIASFLPYNLAVDRSAPGGSDRTDYELKFGGIEVIASIQAPEQGKQLDLKKTFEDDVNAKKGDKRFEGLKTQRLRIKELKDGEMAVYEYKEGTKARRQYYIVGRADQGRAVQLRWTYDADNFEATDFSNRVLFGLQQPSIDNLRGAEVWRAEPFGYEVLTPKPFTKVKQQDGMVEWNVDTPGMVATLRVVSNSARIIDPLQTAQMLDASFKALPNVSGYKSTIVPVVYSAVDGQLVKSSFKLGSGGTNHRYGLVLTTWEAIYVLDILAMDEEQAKRMVESVRVNIELKDGPRHKFKNSIFSIGKTDDLQIIDGGSDANYESTEIAQRVVPGKALFSHIAQRAKTGLPVPNGLAKNYLKEVANSIKSKEKILNEGWAFDGDKLSYWIAYEMSVSNVPSRGYVYVTVLGRDVLVQNILYFNGNKDMIAEGQAYANSALKS